MKKLKKYTLTHNDRQSQWDLVDDKSKKTVESFDTKREATAKDVLRNLVSSEGSSVKIRKENGQFQEERTYPKSRDPTKSKG